LSIFFILYQSLIFLKPIADFFSILFAPIAISLLFYYLLRPIVYFFEKYGVPRAVSILCIYILLALGIIFFIAYAGPILTKQIAALADTSVTALDKLKESSKSVLFRLFDVNLDFELEQRLFVIAQQITSIVSQNLVQFLSFLTRLATVLAVIPFIVFYLLKNDHDFSSTFLCHIPEDYALEIRKTLRSLDVTLSNYITGLAIVSFSVGALLFIGYLIIGLNYAFILSMIAIVFMTIPFLGPFLSIAPALLVGLSDSPWMVIKVAIVFLIVQQTESNFISPQVIGQRLNIHPLTIILLLMAAGSLYGLIGLIFATPVYALAKSLIENGYKIARLHYGRSKGDTLK
jgi:predicted PurR-regulated permease PerM